MIHAHEILNMLKDNDGVLTKDLLKQRVVTKFGEQALFTNCSGNPYNFDEMFQFFIDREKIIIQDDNSISLLAHNMC